MGARSDTMVCIGWNPKAYQIMQRGSKVWNGGWLVRCGACGFETHARTAQLKAGSVRCTCRSKRAPKELTGQIFEDLIVLGKAENSKSGKARWRCRCRCGKEIIISTDKLTGGRQVSCGCGRKDNDKSPLRRENQRKFFKKNREEIYKRFRNHCDLNGLDLLTSFEDFEKFRSTQHSKLNFRCRDKKHEFELAWFNMQNHLNCRVCNAFRSKAEREVFDWIGSQYTGQVLNNFKKIPNVFEVDIYLPELKIAIDYNGLFPHSELCREARYHIEKREELNGQGISFFQINGDEWDYKRPIIQSILMAKLGISPRSFFARKLKITKPGKADALNFLKTNHLMGSYSAGTFLGLATPEGELVSVLMYQNKKGTIEIARYATILNTQVVGGLSRLLKETERQNPEAKTIQSHVDLRYGTGDSLLRTGFHLEKISLGWKWTDCNHTFNRRTCRANIDSRKLPEAEYAKERKWVRIYDAGQALFKRTIKK